MISTLKKYYNATTTSISNYVEISLSTINSVLANRRTFNLQVLDKLTPLYKELQLKIPVTELAYATEFILKEEQNAALQLEQLRKKVAKSLRNREETLQELQKKRAIVLRGLHACTTLLHQNNLTVKDTKWITQRKRDLELVLLENDYVKEVKLQSEVAGLQTTFDKVLEEIERLKSM